MTPAPASAPGPTPAGPLAIRIKKGKDGPDTLVCRRPDGTHAIQYDRTGGFFPIHDLTHYAVESVLGFRRGFFGLVASGWDFTDFGAPWRRGRLEPESITPELIVGALDLERAGGYRMAAAELNALLRAKHGDQLPESFIDVTEEQLAEVRSRMHELFRRWRDTPPGESIELVFGD